VTAADWCSVATTWSGWIACYSIYQWQNVCLCK